MTFPTVGNKHFQLRSILTGAVVPRLKAGSCPFSLLLVPTLAMIAVFFPYSWKQHRLLLSGSHSWLITRPAGCTIGIIGSACLGPCSAPWLGGAASMCACPDLTAPDCCELRWNYKLDPRMGDSVPPKDIGQAKGRRRLHRCCVILPKEVRLVSRVDSCRCTAQRLSYIDKPSTDVNLHLEPSFLRREGPSPTRRCLVQNRGHYASLPERFQT